MGRLRWQEGKRGDRVRDSFTELAQVRSQQMIGQIATNEVVDESSRIAVEAYAATHGINNNKSPMPRAQRFAEWFAAQQVVARNETYEGFSQ